MACERVPGYREFEERVVRKLIINSLTDSTIKNYSRHLAAISMHYGSVPTDLNYQQIDDYLYYLQIQRKSPSLSYFKITVSALRFAFKMYGLKERYIELPKIRREQKLPVVLSKEEVKRMLEVTTNLKHRVLLQLLYGCGLRCGEARNLRLADIDLDRMMIHVRGAKGGKDRYVPLSSILAETLEDYIAKKPKGPWLFNGRPIGAKGGDFCNSSQKIVWWVVRQSALKANIHKHVSVHTLRHTFATHLLEDGLDIVTIKELLGHAKIQTTMVYLHVARCGRGSAFSPLDTLYGLREPEFKHGICPYFVNSVKAEQNAGMEAIKKALSR